MAPPPRKRKRMSYVDSAYARDRSVTLGPSVDTPSEPRLVRLEVGLNTTLAGHVTLKLVTVYLSEEVCRDIHHYIEQLDSQPTDAGGMIAIVGNHGAVNKEVFENVIKFLHTGRLAPLTDMKSVDNLALVYQVSLDLSIPKLEGAVVSHLDTFNGFTQDMFIDLASRYFAKGEEAQKTSFGCYLKWELEQRLPSLYNCEKVKNGELGKVYVEVLERKCKSVDQEAFRKELDFPVKIEDD